MRLELQTVANCYSLLLLYDRNLVLMTSYDEKKEVFITERVDIELINRSIKS